MMNIYYENSVGTTLDLLSPPYCLQTGDFFDYEWSFTSVNRRNGEKINSFYKDILKKTMTLSILNFGEESYCNAINHFFDTTEYDVINKTPGKLYVGQQYVECYITASRKSEWESDSSLIDNELDIAIEYPFWISENPYTFHNFGLSSTSNKDYHGKYPYRYANGMNSNYIINPHFVASNFQMAIYGPVVNPQVAVGGVSYLVNIVLEDGEYLIIDSRTETIIKVMRNGEQVNAYHNRQKGRAFFRKIPPGRQTVSWTGKFDFDLTIYEERSEPKWIE